MVFQRAGVVPGLGGGWLGDLERGFGKGYNNLQKEYWGESGNRPTAISVLGVGQECSPLTNT